MYIIREEYLKKLFELKDSDLIKVVTGVRRCGKSTLFVQFQDYLIKRGILKEQIIYINFEDYDNEKYLEPKALYEYIKSLIKPGRKNYIFLDEIQNVKDFQKVVDSLYIKKEVDLYITGSNAYFLSSDLATLLSGRYIEIKMLPLSFKEYVLNSGSKDNLETKYRDYILNGSFPYTLELKNNERVVKDYLEGLLNTIVIKDIIQRNNFNDVILFQSVLKYLFDNIGNLVSSKRIADSLTSNGRKVDSKTIEKYLNALIESFVIYSASRFNIKGKEYLKSLEKYYVVDIGLRHALLGQSNIDVGHMLENIVYLELIRRGYDVYVGKYNDLEIDFVAKDDKNISYFQVAATVRDENVLKRELTPLRSIKDQYPKCLLTLDNDPDTDFNGIQKLNVLEWLIN